MSHRNSNICERQPLSADNRLRLLLQQARLKATATRLAVLRQLSDSLSPLTHAELLRRLSNLATDKSTIFRALQNLVERGLAKRMDLGDHAWRYEVDCELPQAGASHAHPHLLCVHCGTVTCLAKNEVELRVAASVGAIEEILIRGACNSCTTNRK